MRELHPFWFHLKHPKKLTLCGIPFYIAHDYRNSLQIQAVL